MLHVAILVHRHGLFEFDKPKKYWLAPIFKCWEKRGIRVSVVANPRKKVDADMAILHVNLTTIPAEYLDFVRRYPIAINGGVADISKRSISAHVLDRRDRYQGPVIIKPDRNCQGVAEKRIARKALRSAGVRNVIGDYSFVLREAYRRLRRRWLHGSAEAFANYPIFDSMGDVPDEIW